MKREVQVSFANDLVGHIVFYATNDAVSAFKGFGDLSHAQFLNQWDLFVDARFDFDEVLAYIENYGKESE